MGKKKRSKKKSKKTGSSSTSSAGATTIAEDDIDKQCEMRLAEFTALEKKMAGKKLRFAIGDRVECKMHVQDDDMMEDMDVDLSLTELLRQMAMGEGPFEMAYKPGTVVHLWYPRNKGEVYPYQIRLDEDNSLIYATEDEDSCIRRSNAPLPVLNPRDMQLFKQPPAREDCPICFLSLPLHMSKQTKYFSCCGKVICAGCVVAAQDAEVAGVSDACPFCRAPWTQLSKAELRMRREEGIKRGDPEAMEMVCLEFCENGNEEEKERGNQLLQKAANLGLCSANYRLGCAYFGLLYGVDDNFGVEEDVDKAMFHFEAAAIAGHGGARYNIGLKYCNDSSTGLGAKHLMIGAKSGYKDCMDAIKEMFAKDCVTKTEFEETLLAYQKSLDELKSEQRDKAALIYS